MDGSKIYYTIVFSDLVASKLVMRSLPSYITNQFLREHGRIAFDIAQGLTQGEQLPFQPQSLGDGNLFIFNEVEEGLTFALCISKRWNRYRERTMLPCLEGYPLAAQQSDAMKMRVAVHFGPVYRDDTLDFAAQIKASSAINTAFVLQHLASPGEVMATEAALALTYSSLFLHDFCGRFDPLQRKGEAPEEEKLSYHRLKGIGVPPRYNPALVALPQRQRRRIGLNWFWHGMLLDTIPTPEHEAAIAAYREAVTFDPSLAKAWNNLGARLTELERYPEAIDCLAEGLKSSPEHVYLLTNLCTAYHHSNRLEEAIAVGNQALSLAPDMEYAFYNLGSIYLDLNELQQAEEHFRRAIEINPLLSHAHYDLACVLCLTQRAEEGLTVLRKALDLNPYFRQDIEGDKDLVILKDDPRFLALVEGR